MRKYLRLVDQHKASSGKRLANFFLDRIFIQIIFYVIVFIIAFAYAVFYGRELNTDDTAVSFVFIGIYVLLSFFYFFGMEYFTGKTFAKFITATEVISIDGNKPTSKQIAVRTISRAVPFDQLSFLGNNGWHDNWSDTRVINIKNYEAERQAKSEIENIGMKENV
ncbi:RDD family protein [Chryseobacterium gregarium]|uniref:RDD family protein n=1 Tax=Chryseobacterium gregarium TaxID=456299 RepID=UPI0003FCDCC6|nr:RDD family protein [Chryseobacterium gregarium]